MDIYETIVDNLSKMPLVEEWPEITTAFTRAASRKPRHWRLPLLACEAVGGNPELAIPAVTAVGCLHISILLIDDMLDADPRGEHHRLGYPATANMAVAFLATGLESIARSETTPPSKFAALGSLIKMMWTTCFGQYLDALNIDDEDSYWRLVRLKSSPFFGAALQVGALLGTASVENVAERIKEIGELYGEMIQIHDDLNDALETPANPDWGLGHKSLPILYATSVDHPDRDRFIQLQSEIRNPDALTEAQSILVRSGAVSYCIDQILRKYKAAREILMSASLVNRKGLDDLLHGTIAPIERLISVTGIGEEGTLLKILESE